MSNALMRVGIIGTGFGQRVVAPAFEATPDVEVVDVVTARDDAAIRELCARPDLDLISVHSPPGLHHAHVTYAAEAGHAVLCDKPLGIDKEDAAATRDVAVAAGVVHLMNLEFRADPVRERVLALVAEGAVGTIEHIAWVHLTDGTRNPLRPYGWLFDASQHGGVIQGFAPHAVDYVRLLVGEIASVEGQRRLAILERPDRDGVVHQCTAEDGFSAQLEAVSGATVMLDVSFASSATLTPRIVISGSEGVLIDEGDTRLTLARGAERDVVFDANREVDHHQVPMRRYAAQVRDVVQGRDPGTTLPTFDDGVAIERVLDEFRRAPLVRIDG